MPNDPKSAIKGSRHPSAVSSGTSSFPRENGYPKLCLLDRDSVKNWNRPHERPSSSRAFSLIPLLDCHEAGPASWQSKSGINEKARELEGRSCGLFQFLTESRSSRQSFG